MLLKRCVVSLGIVLLACFGLVGCNQVGYYQQAIGGQVRLLAARQPIARVLADAEVDAKLRGRLQTAQRMLSFIQAELHLQPEKRYRTYVALDRSAVVYNLVATPNLSVEPQQWCYPIVGCAPYRGYFQAAAAQQASERFQAQGLTTFVGEVPAYSTLGWFDDPLLSSFIFWPDAELVALLAHEVSHSKLWVNSDVAFNEAFASFVGSQAALVWLQRRDQSELIAYQARQRAWVQLRGLLLQLRQRLQTIYAQSVSNTAKLAQQEQAYAALRSCYEVQRVQLGGGRYDGYVAKLNNAVLAALATYDNFRPAFAQLYSQEQQRWPEFYAAADNLKTLDIESRHKQLQQLAEEYVASDGDDDHADQVQCQALTDHGLHVESPSAVNDDVGRGRHG